MTTSCGKPSKPNCNCQNRDKPCCASSAAATNTGGSGGNSVILNTGQFTFALDLLSIAGLGSGSWDFSIEYLAGNGIDDIVGMGFAHSQLYQLIPLVSGDVALITPDNLQEIFINMGNGQYSSAYNNTMATLVETGMGTANDTFILTSNSGTVATFYGFYSSITTPGRMKSMADRYGNAQTLTWALVGGVVQLAGVTDAYGRTINYSYYGSTGGYLLSQITDFMGRQLNFQYDSAGRLVAAVLPSINSAAPGNTFPNGTAYVFQYDVNNADPNRQNDLINIYYPNQTLSYINSSRVVDVASVYASATPRYTVTYGQGSTNPDYGMVLTETVGDPANGIGGTSSFSYSTSGLPTNIIDPADPIVSQTTVTDRNGNQVVYNFDNNGMVVMEQVNTNRSKSSLETGPYITWTAYNLQNQEVYKVMPAGDSIAYTYDSGLINFGGGAGPQLYPPRAGLLLSETRFPGNTIGIASRPGSNGQTQLTTSYFYDPIYNQQCAVVEPRGNPIGLSSGSNVYFTPQNGGTTPSNADHSRYATITYFDYQKNQTATITGSTYLQNLLGLTAGQIQALINYANAQMTSADGTGGLPNGFQTNLGDINGDGTGDGNSSGLAASSMFGSPVEVQHPAVYQLIPSTGSAPWAWQTQQRIEVFTNNALGQTTTQTNPEGNITVYVRFPQNNPDGDFDYYDPNLSNNQYGRIKEIHVDVNPSTVMTLVGAEGDMVAFTGNIIPRTNTPGAYQSLVTAHQGATGCTKCNYDPLGNILTTVDARGNLTTYNRNELGEIYQVITPAPYSFQVETYYDANRNTTRTDTQDMQVLYTSSDPTDPNYAKFTPSGSGSTANVPMQAGPGGSVRSGWFTNLYTFDLLDNKIEDDLDATGSSPASLVTSYQYDGNQNLIQVTKPNGNIIQYDYDERNLRIAQRVGFVAGGDPGSVTMNVFDADGNLLNIIGPAQRGTSNNSLSVTIANAFNSGSPLTQTGDWLLANTFDGFNRIISVTDSLGDVTQNSFDPGNRNIQAQTLGYANGAVPTGRTGSNNVPLSTGQTRFDEAGRAYESQLSVFLNTGISGGVPTNNLPSLRAATHTGGGLAANSTTNSNTGTITLTTGGSGYTLTRTVFDRADRVIGTGSDNGAVSTMAYDGANRMILSADPLGNTVANQFDGNSNLTSTTRTEQCTISSTIPTESFGSLLMYDVLNRLVVRADQGADGTLSGSFTDSSTLFTYHGYDSRGNQTNLIDPKQNTTIMVFDGAGRQLQTLQNLRAGGSGANAITSTVVTQRGFDGNSNQIRLVDNNGGTTVWAYDSHDRQISETYQDGSKKQFAFDLASDVVTFTDANGSVFVNAWDAMGRKTNTAITRASGVGGTTSQSFQYDGLGRLTLSVDPNINLPAATATVQVVYDSLGRTVEESQTFAGNVRYLTNTAFASLPASQFTYPDARQVNSGHDALYRKNSLVEQSTGASVAAWQFFGNRVATVALGNGLLCSNMNNAQNRSAIQSGQTTPPWGSITTDQLGYDGAARMIGKRYFNGSNVVVGFTSAYDESSNKLFERPLHAESRSSLYDSYDSMNRLLDDQRGVLATGGGSITTPITLPDTDTDRNWNLDGLGNWTSTGFTPVGGSAGTDQRNHNKLNEIIQRSVTGAAPVTFQYDGATGASNGNLTSDGSLIYLYDALNRLIQVSKVIVTSPIADFGGVGGGAVGSVPVAGGVASSVTSQILASYFYDAMNRRIRKVVVNGGFSEDIPNGTTDYLWQGWQCMEERNPFGGSGSTDAPIRQYVWGQYIDECIQLTTLAILGPRSLPADAYYLLQDLLYRAVALTNGTGGIVEAYDTDAYGNTLIFTGPGTDGIWFTDDDVQSNYGANEIIFCGYRFDPETQVYYVRNRTYNPMLGRWIQRDPIGYSGGVNIFEYVGDSPAVAVDSHGLFTFTQWLQIVGAGISTVPHTLAGIFWREPQRLAREVPRLPLEALRGVARSLYKKYCHCKQRHEGNYIGVNLGTSLGEFKGKGAAGMGGIQALILCASKDVSFYWYAGAEGGVGGGPTPVSWNVMGGLTGGAGVYRPSQYTGWFVGGQASGGAIIGTEGGLYKSPSGSVTNWLAGAGYTTPGFSLTTGGEYYFLIGTVHI